MAITVLATTKGEAVMAKGSSSAGPVTRATMADIARRLDISKAAVSYALNGQPGVSSATREKVLDLAKDLGWYASSSARALAGAETGVIGLVLARPSDLPTRRSSFISSRGSSRF